MKKLLLFIGFFVILFHARTSQLAFIVLNTGHWESGRLPMDWMIKVHFGRPDISVCTDAESCLHLKSVKSSFALEHSVSVDTAQMPWLAWKWKVTQLPGGADFRRAATDDQAAQVLVAFEDSRIVAYIWDTTAPQETMQSASSIPLVHIFAVVCRSGGAQANQWVSEARNVAADYQRAYKRSAPRVKGLRLQINSQHTGTIAESYFGEIAFHGAPPE